MSDLQFQGVPPQVNQPMQKGQKGQFYSLNFVIIIILIYLYYDYELSKIQVMYHVKMSCNIF